MPDLRMYAVQEVRAGDQERRLLRLQQALQGLHLQAAEAPPVTWLGGSGLPTVSLGGAGEVGPNGSRIQASPRTGLEAGTLFKVRHPAERSLCA